MLCLKKKKKECVCGWSPEERQTGYFLTSLGTYTCAPLHMGTGLYTHRHTQAHIVIVKCLLGLDTRSQPLLSSQTPGDWNRKVPRDTPTLSFRCEAEPLCKDGILPNALMSPEIRQVPLNTLFRSKPSKIRQDLLLCF